MFYVKAHLNDETVLHITLTDENVFTVCPECGKEHQVDISEMFEAEGFDLWCNVYCLECSKKHAKRGTE